MIALSDSSMTLLGCLVDLEVCQDKGLGLVKGLEDSKVSELPTKRHIILHITKQTKYSALSEASCQS